jgi:ribosomal protein S6--L-glutamate ligase
MKTLILSNSPNAYSTRRLVEEIKARKEEHEVIDPRDLYAYISSTTSGHDRIYKRGVENAERIKVKNFDAIIPRVAGANFEHGAMIVKQLTTNMGLFSTGYEHAIKIASNKFLCAQVLSAAKIRNPKQILSHQPGDFKELIDLVGGFPCIAKLQRGSLGLGVMILSDPLSASTSLASFGSIGYDVVLQQYIRSGEPASDLRVFVVGPETKEPKIFAYKRYALDSDFRSNYSISKKGEKVKLTDEERQMAIDAALAVGLGVSGVDILRDANDKNKPYLIEVNSSPGLQGVESVTGENVAGAIIDYIKENYKKGNKFNSQLRQYQEEVGQRQSKPEKSTAKAASTAQLIARTIPELEYIFRTCQTEKEISLEIEKLEKSIGADGPNIIHRTMDAMGKVGTERNTYHSIF